MHIGTPVASSTSQNSTCCCSDNRRSLAYIVHSNGARPWAQHEACASGWPLHHRSSSFQPPTAGRLAKAVLCADGDPHLDSNGDHDHFNLEERKKGKKIRPFDRRRRDQTGQTVDGNDPGLARWSTPRGRSDGPSISTSIGATNHKWLLVYPPLLRCGAPRACCTGSPSPTPISLSTGFHLGPLRSGPDLARHAYC